MKIIGLVSGGKDSCYNMLKCVRDGHEIVALGNLMPPSGDSTSKKHVESDDVDSNGQTNSSPTNGNVEADNDKSSETKGAYTEDELNSFMYQTVGHQALEYYSKAMGVPLYRRVISGKPINQEYDYPEPQKGDEVEDLYELLLDIKSKHPEVEGISVGAIKSNYQRLRAENVCNRLGLKVLAYLWDADQDELLQDMINDGIHAILIKVAVMGLTKEHLGKTIKEMYPVLKDLNIKYGCNICGEGGEFETLTLDCPLFKSFRLVIDKFEIVTHSNDAFAPVAYLKPIEMHLEPKVCENS